MDSTPPALRDRSIGLWLLGCTLTVLIMVVVGGLTRLTHSGLSITEWNVVTGVLPPLGADAWDRAFSLYQASPEYAHVNHGMSLGEFQEIFLVEWAHRLIGRLAGLIFGLPLLYFALRRRIAGRRLFKLVGILSLGGLQGVVGWWMVKSGLVDVPRVSPYRLATHLLLAVALFGLLLWQAQSDLERSASPSLPSRLRSLSGATIGLLFLTLGWGALMAGLHAGLVAPSFPLMNGALVPDGLRVGIGIVEDPLTVHFIHRSLAYCSAALAIALCFTTLRSTTDLPARRWAIGLGVLVLFQIGLGALTVLHRVPISLASLHQVNAVLLFGCAVGLLHRCRDAGSESS